MSDRARQYDSDCSEVLDRVYFFIDNELDEATSHEIQAHLEECGPCLREVDLERLVKALIARSCSEKAPAELRQRVMFSIRQVQIELRQAGSTSTDRPASTR
ncbi:MAG: mycothiol system anti-sigma-R factor [Nocardioidaceae bacterium]